MHLPAADRNLIRSRADSELEVLLATGYKLQLPPYWLLGGGFLAGRSGPSGKAFCALPWLLWELCLSKSCKIEPSLLSSV